MRKAIGQQLGMLVTALHLSLPFDGEIQDKAAVNELEKTSEWKTSYFLAQCFKLVLHLVLFEFDIGSRLEQIRARISKLYI